MSARTAALQSAAHWLYSTLQPPGAILMHHGVTIAIPERNRVLGVRPTGWKGLPLIVIGVQHVEWAGPPINQKIKNPVGHAEIEDIAAELTALGAPVAHHWIVPPGGVGCMGLEKRAHSSLTEAADRFTAGCQGHPEQSTLCECGWYTKGRGLLVPPSRVQIQAA